MPHAGRRCAERREQEIWRDGAGRSARQPLLATCRSSARRASRRGGRAGSRHRTATNRSPALAGGIVTGGAKSRWWRASTASNGHTHPGRSPAQSGSVWSRGWPERCPIRIPRLRRRPVVATAPMARGYPPAITTCCLVRQLLNPPKSCVARARNTPAGSVGGGAPVAGPSRSVSRHPYGSSDSLTWCSRVPRSQSTQGVRAASTSGGTVDRAQGVADSAFEQCDSPQSARCRPAGGHGCARRAGAVSRASAAGRPNSGNSFLSKNTTMRAILPLVTSRTWIARAW